MKRYFSQNGQLNSRSIIALFFVFGLGISSAVNKQQNKPDYQNQQDLSKQLASILANYHSDAETLLRSDDLEIKEEKPPQTIAEKKPKTGETQPIMTKLPKFEENLKIVKRSPRNYDFGLGKPEVKQEPQNYEQIRDLLNYLYNLDLNLILNHINSQGNGDSAKPGATSDDLFRQLTEDDSSSYQNGKYKTKPEMQELHTGQRLPRQFNFLMGKKSDRSSKSAQRLYSFGIGKRTPQRTYEFGLDKRSSGNLESYGKNLLEEYMKRRYSFGIGKRTTEVSHLSPSSWK